jgi:hypothetical protein
MAEPRTPIARAMQACPGTATVYRSDDSAAVVRGSGMLTGEGVLEGSSVELRELFG